MQKPLSLLLAVIFCANLILTVRAEEKTNTGSVATITPGAHTFITTAYYSPLPEQDFYTTGSYEGDIRLNGHGVRGADRTPVYSGMLAAPKHFPFGLKIKIPGLGIGAVHDRGGAIVKAGERGHEHDRLDIWMGFGEEGLRRALAWGKRVVAAVVYNADNSVAQENLSFTKLALARLPKASSEKNSTLRLAANLGKQHEGEAITLTPHLGGGHEGEAVKALQKTLLAAGYATVTETGKYDSVTMDAVFALQKEYRLASSWDDFGAGFFGPKTREALQKKLAAQKETPSAIAETPAPPKNFKILKLGKRDPAVEQLQKDLTVLNLFQGTTGQYFGRQTKDALINFQIALGFDKNELGIFGAKTATALAAAVSAYPESQKKLVADLDAKYAPIWNGKVFTKNLTLGSVGDEVHKLQNYLTARQFYTEKITGYYGATTVKAVTKLQVAEKILGTERENGSGIFGTKTRAQINEVQHTELLKQKNLERSKITDTAKSAAFAQAKAVLENKELTAVKKESAASFMRTLALDDNGEDVKILQTHLIRLGHLKLKTPTGYFGESTQKALLKFQLKKKIVASEKDFGAGVCGPKTQEALASKK